MNMLVWSPGQLESSSMASPKRREWRDGGVDDPNMRAEPEAFEHRQSGIHTPIKMILSVC
eukprot:3426160-Rhodomonas_salina.1